MEFFNRMHLKINQYKIYEKYILYNSLVFGFVAIANAIYHLMTKKYLTFFYDYLALHEDIIEFITKLWTIFSYAFLHFEFRHFLFNMIALYFFGRLFMVFFNAKQFIKHYVLGGIFAGLIFVFSYNIFPALIEKDAILIGASASVFSILFGATAMSPNYNFNLLGILQIPLWVISSLYTLLFISSIPYINTGGELAHLGGAFFGYIYTLRLRKGKDIGLGFERIMDSITDWFKSSNSLKTVHRASKQKRYANKTKEEFNTFNTQKKIDLILEKISKSGYESLTKEEKEFLFRAGK